MIDIAIQILVGLLVAVLGIFSLYLFTRLVSLAILRSMDDFKRNHERKEKKNGNTKSKD